MSDSIALGAVLGMTFTILYGLFRVHRLVEQIEGVVNDQLSLSLARIEDALDRLESPLQDLIDEETE